jgi:ribose transport system permease protein
MVWALIALIIAAWIAYPTFLSPVNLRNLLSQNAALGLVAAGMTLVIIGGGFDLSVGSIYGLGAVAFARVSYIAPEPLSVLAAVIVGASAGLVNALIITRLKVNPFVATLGTASVFLGVGYVWSNNYPVMAAAGQDVLGLGVIAGAPISGWIMILMLVAGGVLLTQTLLGQAIFAVGGSPEAARLAGTRVNLVRSATYVILGALTGLAGAIDASKLGVAKVDQGQNLTLLSISCVILGGNALMGGEGATWRTAVGLAIIAVLTNVLDSLAISTQMQLIVQGTVLVAAVSFDYLVRQVSDRSPKT